MRDAGGPGPGGRVTGTQSDAPTPVVSANIDNPNPPLSYTGSSQERLDPVEIVWTER